MVIAVNWACSGNHFELQILNLYVVQLKLICQLYLNKKTKTKQKTCTDFTSER